jgi:hypothetical protein
MFLSISKKLGDLTFETTIVYVTTADMLQEWQWTTADVLQQQTLYLLQQQTHYNSGCVQQQTRCNSRCVTTADMLQQ